MVLDASDDKELFRQLALLSNEVKQIQKTLQTLDSHESRLRGALDELALEKDIVIEQTNRLEAIVKESATAAVEDAERARELEQMFETEQAALQNRVEDLEKTIRTKEAAVKDLQEEFSAKLEDLNGQVREKENLLQIRSVMVTDLKTASESLSRLISGLASAGESANEQQDSPPLETKEMIREIEERASMEIERLKSDIRQKELALAAKAVELDITKQKMGARIEELEKALGTKKKRKSPRIVSMIADMGVRRFI